MNGNIKACIFNIIRKLAGMFFLCILFVCLLDLHEAEAYQNVVIVIDPGHGGPGTDDESDLGADYNGVVEKNLTLTTAFSLKNELEKYGNVTVYLTRAEDKKMTLKERVDYATALGADAIVSVHYNASEHHRFYGAEVFTSAFGQAYATGYGLAQSIMEQWTEDGAADKGIKTRLGDGGADYYGMIRRGTAADIPTIILEHGYIDNELDFDRIGNEEAWERMGRLDAAGIAQYYGLQKNVVQATVFETIAVDVPDEAVTPDLTPPEDVQVTIDAYDTSTNEVTFTVSATEPDSGLMYFGAETEENTADEENSFMDLKLWEREQPSMTGTYNVPDGYEGKLIVRVYNQYELYSDSTPLQLSLDMDPNVMSQKQEQNQNVEKNSVSMNGTTGSDDGLLQDVTADVSKSIDASKATDADSIVTKTGQSRNMALAGMAAAGVVAGIMLIIMCAISVSTHKHKRHHRKERGAGRHSRKR